MSDTAGLVLYRKFGESVVIDSHIVMTPTYLMSVFEVNGKQYELCPIQEWNNTENTIPIEAGWYWVLSEQLWREDSCVLLMRSAIQLGNSDWSAAGIEMICNLRQPIDYPHQLSRIPVPNLISQNCVVELVCQDSGQETEVVLQKDIPQDIYFAGLKAKLTLDGFRGSFGPVLRVAAPPKHSIVRAELIGRRK